MTDSTTELPVAAIEQRIGAFLEAKTKLTWEPEEDLFTSGAVSSLFAMELVVFVESTFQVAVEGPDLAMDNFRTVRAMSSLVTRLRSGGDGA
ncbi:acyl carrier protein [Streptomyces leeuwenhoekii]|jgi:methoxymalonate biosynthesis acyl carrier protein|uniref:Methoxymalonate Biosynthesis Protein n=1 Tax=Streptomyces leeuwenhoekii TaxID=1437453 RepID=A0A0F7W8Z0_STRLW|nr:acyl carrier protein [Streptomyces leeuwenhoekii]CQR65731.1 Methoxymalonate Biosynthesis Protein [Streptomyces leeuwenhoekii]